MRPVTPALTVMLAGAALMLGAEIASAKPPRARGGHAVTIVPRAAKATHASLGGRINPKPAARITTGPATPAPIATEAPAEPATPGPFVPGPGGVATPSFTVSQTGNTLTLDASASPCHNGGRDFRWRLYRSDGNRLGTTMGLGPRRRRQPALLPRRRTADRHGHLTTRRPASLTRGGRGTSGDRTGGHGGLCPERAKWHSPRVSLGRRRGLAIALRGHTPAMSDDEATWFELQPAGGGRHEAERYRARSEAEQAATAMLIRRPELEFVEVAEYAMRDGEASRTGAASRIAAAQPPAPSEAEVDDLHKLPRGDPEC